MDTWTQNLNVYAACPVHLSTDSVMKSDLESLIENLERGTWKPKDELSLTADAPVEADALKPSRQRARTCWHCNGTARCDCTTCAPGFLSESGKCVVCKGTGHIKQWIQ